MFDNVGDWVMAWAGDPLTVLNLLGVLAWVVLIGVAVAALLGAALAEMRPWMPTTPGEEVTEDWQETQPMPPYGSQGPVTRGADEVATPVDPTLMPGRGEEPPPSRPRSAWVDD